MNMNNATNQHVRIASDGITGEIDLLTPCQFQSNHRSPAKDFKSVPDGFN